MTGVHILGLPVPLLRREGLREPPLSAAEKEAPSCRCRGGSVQSRRCGPGLEQVIRRQNQQMTRTNDLSTTGISPVLTECRLIVCFISLKYLIPFNLMT